MDISYLLDTLNDKQRSAVTAERSNFLVLAGAGSGKTRVLAHRVAWLQGVWNCLPSSIISMTFTNKASIEMRNRIFQLIGKKQEGLWVGTFHGLAHRILRIHYVNAKLSQDFQIIDNQDQLRLLTRVIKDMNLNDKKWLPQQALWYINSQKNEGLRPQHIETFNNPDKRTWIKIYHAYQEASNRAGLIDFSELMIRSYELWLNNPYILHYYRKRFSNILVDEFQDTNSIQYAWLRLLAGNTGNIMIVADDDQSIYGWRGAKIGNIHRFLKDFPNAKTIYLEQNYRSTSNILSAANTLIENNNERIGKRLWTNRSIGEPITLYCALNEFDEARFLIDKISIWKKEGGLLQHCAILYRNNAQSRILEEALIQSKLPYCIYGGMRFFERKEIKEALSYLRLILNRNDDAAFERIVNIPTRGIGNSTLNMIRQISCEYHLTFWKASYKILKEKLLPNRYIRSLKRFLELIEILAKETVNVPLYIQTERIIKDSGLWMMYAQRKGEKEQACIENLKELVTATRQFNYNEVNKDTGPLQAFLFYSLLESKEEADKSSYQDSVQLMTLHAAKGLEFPQVFIVGMEEGMFPSQMSLNKLAHLEEERRLAYVGITRAMKKLTITYAKHRRLYGKEMQHHPSRFIFELPKECIQEFYASSNVANLVSYQKAERIVYRNNIKYSSRQQVGSVQS